VYFRTKDRVPVAEGAVGSRWVRRLRIFRYEVHCWRDGVIPDIAEAVESPLRLTGDEQVARHVIALAAAVPAPVWGRDELGAGEIWNSNSVTAWLIARSWLLSDALHVPHGGRALARRRRSAGPAAPEAAFGLKPVAGTS
jgi:hypothetical protein